MSILLKAAKGNDFASRDDTFRDISDEEVAHYKEHGWVLLKSFLPPQHGAAILSYAKSKMGEDGSVSPNPVRFGFFNSLPVENPDHPTFGPILRGYAKAAVTLQNREASPGVRYFKDSFGVKLPQGRDDGHGKSDWHQDFAAQVADRSGGMVFWSALIDMTPQHGTMAFLSGSHRQGVMGDYRTYGEGNLLDSYPELMARCPSSDFLTLSAGDVTVHSDLCVHAAGPNVSDEPRWTYLVQLNPADARWTGAPSVSFDTTGLTHLETLDEERFPRLA